MTPDDRCPYCWGDINTPNADCICHVPAPGAGDVVACLREVHNAMMTWFSGDYAEHPISKRAAEILCACSRSPDTGPADRSGRDDHPEPPSLGHIGEDGTFRPAGEDRATNSGASRAPASPGSGDGNCSTQHQPTETIMDSSGRIHMMELEAMDEAVRRSEQQRADAIERASIRHTGFVTRDPMPGACDARRVLGALDKLAEGWPVNEPVPESAAALAPLTPFERGYVLGVLAEYRAWLASR